MRGSAIVLVIGLAAQASAQVPRDRTTPAVPADGTAVISGVVLTDDTERRPVRRARVGVSTSDRTFDRTAITDDAGAFALNGLPAGRYLLNVIKPGYVTLAFGAKRPNRPGTPIALTGGQQMTGLSLPLQRASVITGTILDQHGSPVSGISVSVLRYAFVNGERKLTVWNRSEPSDDRGIYRTYGLPAGEYAVSASTAMFGAAAAREDMRVMTDADIRAALDELRAQGTPGSAGGAPRAGLAYTTPNPPATAGYAPVYYPGTTNALQAGTVTLGVGEERSGVDLQLQLVPNSRVEGTLVLPDGTPVSAGNVTLVASAQTAPAGPMFDTMRMARPDDEGRFSFSGVAPGQYTLLTRGSPPGAPPVPPVPAAGVPGMGRTPPLWAATDVAVEGQNVTGVTLTLQQGMTVSGKIVLEGSTLPAPPIARLTVNLQAAQNEVNLGVSAAAADANGQFTITGITPGRYRLMVAIPGARPDTPGWTVKSATIDGQETLDAFHTLRSSSDTAVVTLTDTPTELTGAVQDASGRPTPEYQVVVFAADKQFWTPQSRRIQSVRPTSAGKYTIRNLPAGDYLLAAVIDIESGEQYDPAFLQQLSGAAFRITLAEGEKKTQDIRVGQ